MTPRQEITFLIRSSKQLPCLCLGTLKDFLKLTQRPSRALDLSHTSFSLVSYTFGNFTALL